MPSKHENWLVSLFVPASIKLENEPNWQIANLELNLFPDEKTHSSYRL